MEKAFSPNTSNIKQEKSSNRSSHHKQDLAWNYVREAIDSRRRKVITCGFCGKQYVGSEINSMKHHLAGLNNRSACQKVSSEVQHSMRKSLEENKEKPKKIIVVDLDMQDDEVNVGQSSHQSCSSSSRKRKVSIDLHLYFRKIKHNMHYMINYV